MASSPSSSSSPSPPSWNRAAEFPVALEGDTPRCVLCNNPVTDKPERMTQFDAHSFAPKNTPRIRCRGRMDSLHALVMLAASRARALDAFAPRANHPVVAPDLFRAIYLVALLFREESEAST